MQVSQIRIRFIHTNIGEDTYLYIKRLFFQQFLNKQQNFEIDPTAHDMCLLAIIVIPFL